MMNRKNRSVRSLLAAAAALAGAPAMSLAEAATSISPRTAGEAKQIDATESIDRASTLLDSEQPVRARALLLELVNRDAEALSQDKRDQAYELLVRANRAVRSLPAHELSLQQAELALIQGDVLTAERHAEAVRDADEVATGDAVRAERLLERAEQRKLEFEPLVERTLRRAVDAFENGRYSEAKVALNRVYRSGVRLSSEQLTLLEDYQMRVLDKEQARGEVFDETIAAGAFQPARVRRQSDDPPPEDPPEDPERTANDEPETPETPDEPEEPEADPVAEAQRAEAERLLQQAEAAMGERRYEDAAGVFQRLMTDHAENLSQDERNRVRERLSEARVLMQRQIGPEADVIGAEVLRRDRIRQEAVAEFENLKERARRALETGDTDRARDLTVQARVRVNQARNVMPEAEYENYMDRVDNFLDDIDRTAERLRIDRAREQEARLEREARERAMRQERERDRRITESIRRVQALREEMRYDEALEVVDQILFLDPINPVGLLLRDLILDTKVFIEYHGIQGRRHRSYADQSIENHRAMIAPRDIIEYPEDWPSISFRRSEGAALAEAPMNRRVLAALEQNRVPSVGFEAAPLEKVLAFVKDYADVNVDVDWASLESIGIGRDRGVNLSLRDVPVKTVLDRALDRVSSGQYGEKASWSVEDGILTIASDERLRQKTVTEIYDIKDLLVEAPDYTTTPNFDLASVLNDRNGETGRSPFGTGQRAMMGDEIPGEDRISRIIDILRENVDYASWRQNGGDTGSIEDLGGSLVIRTTARNHREIRGLLSKLREIRAMQINVETRFLLVSQNFFERIGFNVDVYFNAASAMVTGARDENPATLPSDFFSQGRLTRQPSVPGDDPSAQIPDNWSPIGMISNTFGLTSAVGPTDDFSNAILGSSPAMSVSGQFLDDVQVDFLVQATQADRRSVELTAPRLTFTNGQTSNIIVATQQGFVSDLTPVVSDSAVGFDPEVGVLSEGVSLLVEGTVSADRRYVTLNVSTAVSTIDNIRQVGVTAVAGGQLVDSADTESFIEIPEITVTQVQTTVTVPDQGTVLLGGQRLMSEVEVETGVPVLSKLPVLNRFFTNRIEAKEEQTLLILLKPTILIQNEEEERNFPGLLDSLGGFGG